MVKDGGNMDLGKTVNMFRWDVAKEGDKRKRLGTLEDTWMHQAIAFPAIGPDEAHEGPIILSAVIADQLVRRIYVDGGGALVVIYYQCFQQLSEETHNLLLPV